MKSLRYGKDDARVQSYGSTLKILQVVLKSGNLLNKWGFDDSQIGTTVLRTSSKHFLALYDLSDLVLHDS